MVRYERNYRADDGMEFEGGAKEEPTIVINNREVPISQAPEVLRQMEHDIKSGHDKILTREREQLQEQLGSALENDLHWLETHDQKEWANYELTSKGGRGYVGTTDPKPVTTTEKNDNASAANSLMDGEVRRLNSEVERLKMSMVEREASEVISRMKTHAAKFPYADQDAVLLKLQTIHRETGRPATDSQIAEIVQKSHDHVEKHVRATGKPAETKTEKTPSPIPDAGGKIPESEKTKRPKLGTPEFINHISERGFGL